MSVVRSSLVFATGTFLSRITGLLRDAIITGVFGATNLLEIFLVANRIPNMFREMLAEGALGSAFTKVYSAVCEEDARQAKLLLCDAFRLGFLIFAVLIGVGVLAAPLFVKLFTMFIGDSGRPEEFYRYTVGMTRLLFPFLGLAMLSSIAMGVLHQRGRFMVTSVTPALLNLGYITGALVFSKQLTEHGPAWLEQYVADPMIVGLGLGVLLGGLLHFIGQFYFVWKDLLKGETWKFSASFISPDIIKVIKLMVPAAIAASAASINLLVNTNFATSLETGAVSWLNYAFRLFQLPVGLFGVAVASAALPSLTRAIVRAGKKVDQSVSLELQNALEFICWLMVPCMIFLQASHLQLIQVMFQHGRFDAFAAQQTSAALYAYSFGVIAYGLIKVLTAFYFSVDRTTYAMKVSLAIVVINFCSNYVLVKYWGHVGLAATAATTLSMNAFLLLLGLMASKVHFDYPKILKSMCILIFAAACGYFVQKFCQLALSRLDLGVFLGLKLEAALALVVNGLSLALVFAGFGMYRMKWSPKDVVDKIKSFRKS